MKVANVIISFLFISSLLFAQERMILRTNGEQIKLNRQKNLREAITESKIKRSDGKIFKNQFISTDNSAIYNEDTLTYREVGGTFNTNFGFFGQDALLMWFEAPADIVIKGIGFTCADDTGVENATISLRLVKLNWTKDNLQSYNESKQIGYYPSTGDGFNQVDYFGENATGNWVSNDENNPLPPWSNHENPDSNTFIYDLWSDDGYGVPIIPVASSTTAPVYQWIETNVLENEPQIKKGDIFGVVATHDGINLNQDRIGFWADNTIGYPGWKFYENGKTDSTVDAGWWVRMYTWDFAVAMEYEEGPYTSITVDQLQTTLSTEPRTVEATVEGYYSDSLFSKVDLIYTVNGGDEISIQMTANGNIYSADIPGQSPGTEVSYYVKAFDSNGNFTKSWQYYYRIFLARDDNNLIVFNGFDAVTGYPQQYYFGTDTSYSFDRWTYDAWAYGALTKELVDNYKNIFEICKQGPKDYNREVIAEWLSASADHNYMLVGEEWLGGDNGYTDQDYSPGSFEYDILGISHSYNDVSYDGTSGQELPTLLFPQEGTLLGGEMFDKVTYLNSIDTNKIDSVLYNPMYEISQASNWIDGFDVVEETEVFMKAETRGISNNPAVQVVNTGVSRTLTSGNKIVFMSYDPISIDSSPSYFWLGRGDASPSTQSLFWFDADVIGVSKNGTIPQKFSLSQNYPNPFNPTTVISYSVPEKSEVTLKVFNLLGQEVATLVNSVQNVGAHEVNFNASNLSSGIYFYTIKAGSFTSTRKMMLIK